LIEDDDHEEQDIENDEKDDLVMKAAYRSMGDPRDFNRSRRT
jgi:hypothetical protein